MEEAVATANGTWLDEALSQELDALSGASEQDLENLISGDVQKLRDEYSDPTDSLDDTQLSEESQRTFDPASYLKLLNTRSEEHVDYLEECSQFLEQCGSITARIDDVVGELRDTAELRDSAVGDDDKQQEQHAVCQDAACTPLPGDTPVLLNSQVTVDDGESLFVFDFEESLRKRDAELAEMERTLEQWEDGKASGSPSQHTETVLQEESGRLQRLEAELEDERVNNARIQAELQERTRCRQEDSCRRIQAAYRGYRCRKIWRPLIAQSMERRRLEEERAAAEREQRIQRETEDKRRQAEQRRQREAAEQQRLRAEDENKRREEVEHLHRQELELQQCIAEELRVAELQHTAREEQRRKEAETKRLADEAEAQRRAEDAKRMRLEREARTKRLTAEAEQHCLEEEAKRLREAEERERRRKEELEMVRAAEEAERQRLEEAELQQRKRLAEEEEEARQRRCEEERQRRRAEEEEEERACRMAEEELLKRQQEEQAQNETRRTEQRLCLENSAAVRIQAVVRGFLLRTRLYKALCAAQSLTDIQGSCEDEDDDFDYDQEIDMTDFEFDEDQLKFEFDAKEMESLTPLPQRDLLPPLSPADQHPSLVSSGRSSRIPPHPTSSSPVSSHRKVILPPINRPTYTTAVPDTPAAVAATAAAGGGAFAGSACTTPVPAASHRHSRMEAAVGDRSAPKPKDSQLAEQVAKDWGFNNTATVSMMRRRALRFQGKKMMKAAQPQATTEYHWKEYPQRRKKKKKLQPTAGVEDLFSKVKLKSSSMATSSVSAITLPQIDTGVWAGDARLMALAQRLCSSSTSEIISSGSYPLLHSMKAWDNAGKSAGQRMAAPAKKR